MVINNFFSRFISGELPSVSMKFSFHFWRLSSWLEAFSFAFKVLSLLLTSFILCDYLFFTKFLILLICPSIYSNYSFWAFLSLCTCFFLNAIDSQEPLSLAFGLVDMYSAAASKWAVTNFSYSLFGVCL